MADAVSYLHDESVIHGDIRAVRMCVLCLIHMELTLCPQGNILIDHNLNALLSDFGTAVYSNAKNKSADFLSSDNLTWVAPELILAADAETSVPTTEADVYSFALLCIEVSVRRVRVARQCD